MDLFGNRTFLIYFTITLGIISIIINGIAIWRTSKLEQRNWFVILVIALAFPLKDLALILGVIYLFVFSKKKLTLNEIKSWLPR